MGEDFVRYDFVDPMGVRLSRHVRAQQIHVGLPHQPVTADGLLQFLHDFFIRDREAETGYIDRTGLLLWWSWGNLLLLLTVGKELLFADDPNAGWKGR